MKVKIDKVIRTKRKTVAIQITDDAKVIVRAPLDLSEDTILQMVEKRAEWILRKKKQIETTNSATHPRRFVEGESFPYLGNHYQLRIIDNQREPLKFENAFYMSKSALDKAREVFIEWYKKTGYELVNHRASFWAQKCGFRYARIKITTAEKRWGSCSSKGNLCFSYRLVMAPEAVIDYVIVHELVHLTQRSHSKRFWSEVKHIMPDYEKRRVWLKENGHLLYL